MIAYMRQSSGSYASGLHVVAGIMAASVVLPILVSPPRSVATTVAGTRTVTGIAAAGARGGNAGAGAASK